MQDGEVRHRLIFMKANCELIPRMNSRWMKHTQCVIVCHAVMDIAMQRLIKLNHI